MKRATKYWLVAFIINLILVIFSINLIEKKRIERVKKAEADDIKSCLNASTEEIKVALDLLIAKKEDTESKMGSFFGVGDNLRVVSIQKMEILINQLLQLNGKNFLLAEILDKKTEGSVEESIQSIKEELLLIEKSAEDLINYLKTTPHPLFRKPLWEVNQEVSSEDRKNLEEQLAIARNRLEKWNNLYAKTIPH